MKKFFIVPSENIPTLLPSMQAAYGHSNVSARMSINGSLALMEFDTDNLPAGINVEDGMDVDSARLEMDSIVWTTEPSGQNEFDV